MRGRIAFLAALTLALTLAPAWGWAKGEDDATEGKTTDDERAMVEDGVPVDTPSQYRSFASEEELRAALTKEARERGFEIPEKVFEMSSAEEAMASLGVSSAGNETGDLGIFDAIFKAAYATKLNGRWIEGCTRDACDTSWVSTGARKTAAAAYHITSCSGIATRGRDTSATAAVRMGMRRRENR